MESQIYVAEGDGVDNREAQLDDGDDVRGILGVSSNQIQVDDMANNSVRGDGTEEDMGHYYTEVYCNERNVPPPKSDGDHRRRIHRFYPLFRCLLPRLSS